MMGVGGEMERAGRERSDEMHTVNVRARASRGWLAALAASGLLLGVAASASGQQVALSDYAAGYVVLPKIVVHTTGGTPAVPLIGGTTFDTIVQLTNVNQQDAINVHCWWVNANKHCSSALGAICETNADCTAQGQAGPCQPDWSVLDWEATLTPGQPIGFLASQGLNPIPCDPTFPGPGCTGSASGLILGVPEDPFRGELKCLQVNDDDEPVNENDLKAEATIVSTQLGTAPGITTAAAYNGIGFRSVNSGTLAAEDPICLGTAPPNVNCAGEYVPCPGVLHLEHFFENAPTGLGSVATTELTLVPCSEDLGDPTVSEGFSVTAQMLVYNEFEQRFSTSAAVQCYKSVRLSDIDTQLGNANNNDQFSIFSFGIQGTVTGQTRIKGVQGPQGNLGYGILGVACENHSPLVAIGPPPVVARTAFDVQHVGIRPIGDTVYRELPGAFPGP